MAVLSTGEHRARNGVLFVATYAIVFSLICLVFLAVGHLTTSGGKPSATTVSIDIILGLLLLYASGHKDYDVGAPGYGLHSKQHSAASQQPKAVFFATAMVMTCGAAAIKWRKQH